MSNLGHICDSGSYKVGDPRPEGYNAFHEWARVQYRGGLRQGFCCNQWLFPQEPCECGRAPAGRMTTRQFNAMVKRLEASAARERDGGAQTTEERT